MCINDLGAKVANSVTHGSVQGLEFEQMMQLGMNKLVCAILVMEWQLDMVNDLTWSLVLTEITGQM